MTDSLERALRRFIAVGSGLSQRDKRAMAGDTLGHAPPELGDALARPYENEFVVPGNSSGSRPKGPYASLLLRRDQRMGYPIKRQLADGRTSELIYREATYSAQFYRAGAADYARRFDLFQMSEDGLTYQETAFADGRVAGTRLYSGGSGYTSAPEVRFIPDGAAATATVVNGAVAGLRLTERGEDYVEPPRIEFDGGGGSGAEATAYGFGFRLVQPLDIRRLDIPEADILEERVSIDLRIQYACWFDQAAVLITAVDCDLTVAGFRTRPLSMPPEPGEDDGTGVMRDTGRITLPV